MTGHLSEHRIAEALNSIVDHQERRRAVAAFKAVFPEHYWLIDHAGNVSIIKNKS